MPKNLKNDDVIMYHGSLSPCRFIDHYECSDMFGPFVFGLR